MTRRIDRSAALREFGQLVKRKRTNAGISQRDIVRTCRISAGHFCAIEQGRLACCGRSLRRVCSLLKIDDAPAWELRLTGRLPRDITLDQAVTICDLLGMDRRLPDRAPLAAKLRPMLECRMCRSRWKERSSGPPKCCAKCHSRYWRTATVEERRVHQFQSARGLAGWRTRRAA